MNNAYHRTEYSKHSGMLIFIIAKLKDLMYTMYSLSEKKKLNLSSYNSHSSVHIILLKTHCIVLYNKKKTKVITVYSNGHYKTILNYKFITVCPRPIVVICFVFFNVLMRNVRLSVLNPNITQRLRGQFSERYIQMKFYFRH